MCCPQFLVSRDRILAHPKAFYERCQEWLISQQTHSDLDAGKVFEFSWHIIFGAPAVLVVLSTCGCLGAYGCKGHAAALALRCWHVTRLPLVVLGAHRPAGGALSF